MNIDFSQMITLADKEASELVALRGRIASRRWEAETRGITIGGMPVYTDRTTQMKLTAAALRAVRDSNYTVEWKQTTGLFTMLNAEQILAIADAVGDYVQECYSRESVLMTALDNGTFTQDMLEQGWPE